MTLTAGDIDELKTIKPGAYRFRLVGAGGNLVGQDTLGLICTNVKDASKEDHAVVAWALEKVPLETLLLHVLAHERECHRPFGHLKKL